MAGAAGGARNGAEIARERLRNQHIGATAFERPAEVVGWLGAVQAQDYPAAKWALGLRLRGATDTTIEQAFAAGSILRTHVLRPTWHFVLPADIRWLLALTAPRILAATAAQYRRLGLDAGVLARGEAALARALGGGQHATRVELAEALRAAGVATDDPLGVPHILMHAELDGLICSGPRRGKEFTYALLDERAPPARALDRDAALAELALRYFTSHGPATVHDFVWWSGLTVADARAGIRMADPPLASEVVDGKTYWQAGLARPASATRPTAYLLPSFDEYVVGYRDRSAAFDGAHASRLDSRANVLFNHAIVVDAQIVGTWKRTTRKATVEVAVRAFTPLDAAAKQVIGRAAAEYGRFLATPVRLSGEGVLP
jgi:hypothetical protein